MVFGIKRRNGVCNRSLSCDWLPGQQYWRDNTYWHTCILPIHNPGTGVSPTPDSSKVRCPTKNNNRGGTRKASTKQEAKKLLSSSQVEFGDIRHDCFLASVCEEQPKHQGLEFTHFWSVQLRQWLRVTICGLETGPQQVYRGAFLRCSLSIAWGVRKVNRIVNR